MDRLKEKLVKIFIVVINFIFFLKLLKESFKIEDFDYALIGLLLIFGILISLFYTFILDKRRYKIIFTLSLLVISAILFYKYKDNVFNYIYKDFINNILVLNNKLFNKKTTYFYEYKTIFFVLIPLLVSCLITLANLWKNVVIFFNLAIMTCFWYLVFHETVLDNIYYFLVISLVTLSITAFMKKIEEFKNKEIKVNIDIKQIALYSTVIALIIIRLVSILPQNHSGENITQIVDFFENRYAPGKGVGNFKNAFLGEFNLRQSGYSDTESILGGPLTINKKEVFRVSSDKPYYLKGVVKEFYSGSYWSNIEEAAMGKTRDYDFKKSDLKSPGEGESDDAIKATIKELEIFPSKNLNSTSFFTPNNAFDVTSDLKGIFYTKIPTFMADIEVRNPYKVKFFSYSNYENYVEGIQNRPNSVSVKEEGYTFPIRYYGEPYLNYEKRIGEMEASSDERSQRNKILIGYEGYFQLDSNIPAEVFDILNQILDSTNKDKNKLSNYEKALTIRNYLTKNYPYSLNVSEVPKDKDFVYHFLFEEKKGYCTYFASATTILCRIAGIPARYVEGFKTPDNTDGNGRYVVTNAEAHAWTEILINPDKDLWIVVDPATTPTEFEELNNTNTDEEDNDESASSDEDNPNVQKPNKENPMEEELDDGTDDDIGKLNNKLFSYISIIVTIILYCIFRALRLKRRMSIICNSSSVIPLYEYYLDRLESVYMCKPESLGDLEFVEGIKEWNIKEKLSKLANFSYEEFYGETLRNDIDKKEYLDFIEAYVKVNSGKISYILKKYFGS
ncbi:transglutaminase domain-containing protein [Clostridium sp.]|uniref:transglutaminase-like domain-containing protein n=1 Tax=Clostridium sp. TaxID=1506 RepID=UPI002FC69ED9